MSGLESASPVARLLYILERVAQQDEGTTIRVVWARALELNDPEDLSVLLTRVADVLTLAQEARKTVDLLATETDREFLLQPFDGLNHTLARLNFEDSSQHLVRPVKQLLMPIRYSENIVRRYGGAGSLDIAALAELQREIEQLIDRVLNSALPDELREVLVSRLQDVRDAVVDVRLRGPANLEAALDALYGTAGRNKESLASEPELAEQVRAVLRRGYAVMVEVGKIAPIAHIGFKLLSSATGGDVPDLNPPVE